MKLTNNEQNLKIVQDHMTTDIFHLQHTARRFPLLTKNYPPQKQARVHNYPQLSHVVTCAALKGTATLIKHLCNTCG